MRLIDADALIESIKNTADLGGWIGEALYQIKQVAIKYIDSAPSIEPKQGKWNWQLADNGWADHICSECGYTKNTDIHVKLGYNYCPRCGAEMQTEPKFDKDINVRSKDEPQEEEFEEPNYYDPALWE